MLRTCENCNKEFIPIDKYHVRFCSNKCARSFSTKNIKGKKKKVICEKCKKEFLVPLRSGSKICPECKNVKRCVICGRLKSNDCEFCERHNMQQVRTIFSHFNLDKSKIGTPKIFDIWNSFRDKLYDMYWNQGMSSNEISQALGYKYPSNLVGKIFNYMDIPRRSFSDASILSFKAGRSIPLEKNQYKSCWHTTWDNNKVYLRSSYELDYAKYLDEQKIHYEVESLRIPYIRSSDNKAHIAIPDFYIPSKNMIVEIKSLYTLDAKEMNDKKISYIKAGYEFKLILEHKEENIEDFL